MKWFETISTKPDPIRKNPHTCTHRVMYPHPWYRYIENFWRVFVVHNLKVYPSSYIIWTYVRREGVSYSCRFSVVFFPFLNQRSVTYTMLHRFLQSWFSWGELSVWYIMLFQWIRSTTSKTNIYFTDFWMMSMKMHLCQLRKRKRSVMRSYRTLCCFCLRLGQMLIWGWFSENRKEIKELILYIGFPCETREIYIY